MKLVRFATLYLERKVELDDNLCFESETTSVHVQDASHGGEGARLLLQAVVGLDAWPEVDSSGVVVVPEQPRKEAERGIEVVGNLLSVLNHSSRRISSPRPFVALGLEDSREIQWVAGLTCFQGNHSGIPQTSFCLPPSAEHLEALSDRLDGVALLAEALAQGG
jgi:hypothetical protein